MGPDETPRARESRESRKMSAHHGDVDLVHDISASCHHCA